MTTINSTTITGGLILVAGDNPVTVALTAYVAGPYGILGTGTTTYTITQLGTVKGAAPGTIKDGIGIELAQPGTITNGSAGLIQGQAEGVLIANTAGYGLVINAGVIAAGTNGSGISIAASGQVTNAATGVILSGTGVGIDGNGGLVSNRGQIAGGSASGAYGIFLGQGGSVSNGQGGQTTATIQGYVGVEIATSLNSSGTVNNYGTILGTGAAAVSVMAEGTLINGGSGATAALLQGYRYGVELNETGTVTNYATIAATGMAVSYGMYVGGLDALISNIGAAALISGAGGATIAGGTVVNSGIIASTEGPSGVALSFGGGSNLLIDEPGGTFVGTVTAAPHNSNTIELGGSVAGTIADIGTSFANFGTVLVDAAAAWTMTGTNNVKDISPTGGVTIGPGANLQIIGALNSGDAFALNGGTLNLAGTIDASTSFTLSGTSDLLQLGSVGKGGLANIVTGFGPGDKITLTNVAFDTTGTISSGANTLSVPLLGGTFFTFSNFTSTGAPTFLIASSNTFEDAACFASGTRIRTERGEVAVEALDVGDIAVLADGRLSPIVWIGRRAVECHRHPDPDAVRPIRVAAGALGIGVPVCDLVLSPDHALYLSGVLIPVRLLVNDRTIARLPTDSIAYYHVELPEHDLLLAEGAAAESFLDTGNRAAFSGGSVTALFPDFAAKAWETRGCAPLVFTGPALVAARAEIAARVERQFRAG